MPLSRLLLPFAAAYFLSYFYRTANAVIGPELARELALSAGDLGLLTSTYLLAFCLAQLPLGMLLDRFGARRVESALLLFAAAGAAAFALAGGLPGLATARAAIGLGVSACLMAAFKAFSQCYPADRQASLTGWMMTAGGLGALAATAPLEALLALAGWREIFWLLAAATLAAAVWLFLGVADPPAATPTGIGLAAQWRGVRQIFASRHFWRFAPLGLTLTGGFMAVQGLWSIAWLMQVNGYTRAEAADHLAAMSFAMLFTYVGIGLLATRLAHRGIPPIRLLAGGVGLSIVMLALIAGEALPWTRALWIAYGACAGFGTLGYAQTAAGFPLALAGRATTAYNLLVFAGAFGAQWGMGLLIDLLVAYGRSPADALRAVFATLLALQIAAYAAFVLAGRRR
ncbi:MFS transporter [Azospira restricta]|uniref:MFS transporter n=1 Tax=Azospira restricta TaxID=404405 RepID=A0A974Y4F7_9RHOO|nr:MFS transporter [Azospira restricta]QRJ64401.1 MFS transporter [Azospira restricta]